MQEFEKAESELIEVHSILTNALGADHRHTQTVIQYAIELYDAWGKPQQLATWKEKLANDDP